MVLSAFLLALQSPVLLEPRLPTLAEREAEWRRLTDVEPTPLIADLNLGLLLPKVADAYRGRLRYEGLAASAGRDLNWIEGIAVMRVPDPAGEYRTDRVQEIAGWLRGLSPEQMKRLQSEGAFVGELPEGPRRALVALLPAVPADVLGARFQIEAAYHVAYRTGDAKSYTVTRPAVPSPGFVLTQRSETPPPVFVPPVIPLPPKTEGALRFPEGKALTVRELLREAYRTFGRVYALDERVAERTLFVRGSFEAEGLERALVPITRVEAIQRVRSVRPESEPDFVGGSLSSLWKDLTLPSGVSSAMLRRDFEVEAGQADSYGPVISGILARGAVGRARVRGSVSFSVNLVGFGSFQIGVE